MQCNCSWSYHSSWNKKNFFHKIVTTYFTCLSYCIYISFIFTSRMFIVIECARVQRVIWLYNVVTFSEWERHIISTRLKIKKIKIGEKQTKNQKLSTTCEKSISNSFYRLPKSFQKIKIFLTHRHFELNN